VATLMHLMSSAKSSPPHTLSALNHQIQQVYPDMTPQFQIGARYLLDHPRAVSLYSMRQIASQAGVQPATLVRLAQSLNYSGWQALKQVFINHIQNTPETYTNRARALINTPVKHTSTQQTLQAQIDNLHQLQTIQATALDQAVRHIGEAKHVYIGGFRASYAVAFSLHYLYRLFRRSVSLLSAPAGTLEMDLDAIEKRDVVIISSFAPYSSEALKVYEAAKSARARIISLCDSVVAPMAHDADVVLTFHTATHSFFPSVTSASALAEILIEQLLAAAGEQAIKDLERRESRLHMTGAYIP